MLEDWAALAVAGRAGDPAVLHLLTSPVAGKISVDAALAIGGDPSLSQDIDEVRAFAPRVRGALINLGMWERKRGSAADALLDAVDRPWALDPVKIERSPARRAAAMALAARKPAAVKANVAEATALGPVDAPLWTTGEIDSIVAGPTRIGFHNGHPLMTRTTAIGCAAGAVLAALLAMGADGFAAAAAAALICGVAGELAAARCGGPGSFPAAWIDALGGVDAKTLIRCARPVDV
ncbi:MAG: hydroxyethylthiazole kinase [Pseudomonadota bacterium]